MTILKKMKMLMLTDGNVDNASARIRAMHYIPFFEANGYLVSHIPRAPKKPVNLISKYTVFPFLKRWYYLKIRLAILSRRWDVVFIQRIFISEILLKLLNKRSIPVIYDFDDAIYINTERPQNFRKTANMVKHADKVIVSTNYLEEFCLKLDCRAEVIPSPVDTNRICPTTKQKDHLVTIGWIGSPSTSVHLELIEGPLKKLAFKYSFRFLTVGANPEYKISGINYVAKPWSFEDENEDIGQMNIGIMPLLDTEYTKMKGGYKLLQYMSAGIPCVASPVGINQSIVRPGENGYLASTEAEWYSVLEKLINDQELCSKLGENGRKDTLEFYSREVCFEKLIRIIVTKCQKWN